MTPEEAHIILLRTMLSDANREIQLLKSNKIDKEMLKTLILLCHPDKHNNSSGSEKAIKFLLKMRK